MDNKMEWCKKRLNDIRGLTHDWNTYGAEPISESAISLAESFLEELSNHSLLPDTILPGDGEETYIYFSWLNLGLDTDFYASGQILIGIKISVNENVVYDVIEVTPETYIGELVRLAQRQPERYTREGRDV